MELYKENDLEHKIFIRAAATKKLDQNDSEGFDTRRERIREELQDETAGIWGVEKLPAIMQKQDQKLQLTDENITTDKLNEEYDYKFKVHE